MQKSSDEQRPAVFAMTRNFAALFLVSVLAGCHRPQAPTPLPVAVVSVAVQAGPVSSSP